MNKNMIKYTVDDEEPDCCKCEHCCDDEKYCIKYCGPEHGWNRYERYINIDNA